MPYCCKFAISVFNKKAAQFYKSLDTVSVAFHRTNVSDEQYLRHGVAGESGRAVGGGGFVCGLFDSTLSL